MAIGRDPRNHPDTPGFNAWLEREEAKWWAEEFPKIRNTFLSLTFLAAVLTVGYDVYSEGKISGIKY